MAALFIFIFQSCTRLSTQIEKFHPHFLSIFFIFQILFKVGPFEREQLVLHFYMCKSSFKYFNLFLFASKIPTFVCAISLTPIFSNFQRWWTIILRLKTSIGLSLSNEPKKPQNFLHQIFHISTSNFPLRPHQMHTLPTHKTQTIHKQMSKLMLTHCK